MAGTKTFSPVFGLRPCLERRCRIRKLPKPRSSIFSSLCKASMIDWKTVFKRCQSVKFASETVARFPL